MACAQAFHRLAFERALAEALRVLRPGGALALWWNVSEALGEPWMRRRAEAYRERPSGYAQAESHTGVEESLQATGLLSRLEHVDVHWERRLTVEDYLGYVGSQSAVVRLGAGAPAFLDAQRGDLVDAFPDGVVVERFRCALTLARPR